jgi:hypothetical protein
VHCVPHNVCHYNVNGYSGGAPEEMVRQPVRTELWVALQLAAGLIYMHDAVARLVTVAELKRVKQAPGKVGGQVGAVLGHSGTQAV